MNMKYIKLIVLLILSVNLANSQENLSMKDAIKLALEHNYSIKIVKTSSDISKNNVDIGNAGMLPSINAQGGATYSLTNIDMDLAVGARNTSDTTGGGGIMKISQDNSASKNYNAGINLNWTIFDGFAMFISYDKFEELRDKSEIEVQLAIEGLVKNLVNTYYQAANLKENLEILKKNIEISRDRFNRMEDKAKLGIALKIEVLKAQVDLNNDSTMFMQTELTYNTMLRQLDYLIGSDLSKKYTLDSKIDFVNMPDFENLKTNLFAKNSSINQAIAQKNISELDYKMINSSYFPRVNFSTGYTYTKQTNDAGFMLSNASNGFNVGLNFSWNLFNGNKNKIQSQNAELLVKINDLKYNDIKKQMELSLNNSYDQYLKRKEILDLSKANIQTAEQNFRRSSELYKLGKLTSVDFRESQINLLRAKFSLNQAGVQVKLSEVEILILSGMYFDLI